MDTAADLALFRAERDALAFLGLLSSLYLRFDPPISYGDGDTAQPTHFQGLNVHALVIDNADGLTSIHFELVYDQGVQLQAQAVVVFAFAAAPLQAPPPPQRPARKTSS